MFSLDVDKVMVVGDWHGDSNFAMMVLQRAKKFDARYVFHTGDFGLWDLHDDFLNTLHDFLLSNDMFLVFADGNHENFNILRRLEKDSVTGLMRVTDRIFHAPRGYRLLVGDSVWMFLGGAVSMDQNSRMKNIDWFPDEVLTMDDISYALRPGTVDVMVTHDAPYDSPTLRKIYSRSNNDWNANIVTQSDNNQKMLQKVVDLKNPHVLFHGHHHRDYVDFLANGTKIVGLDCNRNNVPIRENYLLVNTDATHLCCISC